MNWPGAEVRQLRQRLGWSRAELARRLGVTLAAITDWEDSEKEPPEDYSDNLGFLRSHVDSHCDSTSRKPVAEALMSHLNLSQIHAEQIEVGVESNPQLFCYLSDKPKPHN